MPVVKPSLPIISKLKQSILTAPLTLTAQSDRNHTATSDSLDIPNGKLDTRDSRKICQPNILHASKRHICIRDAVREIGIADMPSGIRRSRCYDNKAGVSLK